jgi:hypothetical protein
MRVKGSDRKKEKDRVEYPIPMAPVEQYGSHESNSKTWENGHKSTKIGWNKGLPEPF